MPKKPETPKTGGRFERNPKTQKLKQVQKPTSSVPVDEAAPAATSETTSDAEQVTSSTEGN